MITQEKNVKKHQLRKWLLRIAALLSVLTLLAIPVVLAAWHWYLPGFLIDRVFPEVRNRLGLDDATVAIRRLGWQGADFENFHLADGEGGVLEIDSIRADYLPRWPSGDAGYLTVTSLILSGLDCSVTVKDGKTEISGFRLRKVLEALDRANAGAAAPSDTPARPPVILKKLILRHLELKLNIEGRRLTLPVNAVFRSDDPAWRKIAAEIEIAPRGQILKLNAEFDRTTGKLLLTTSSQRFRLDPLADFIGFRGGSVSGETTLEVQFANADLTGKLDLDLAFTPPSGVVAGAEFSAPVKLKQKLDFSYRSREELLTAAGSGNAEVPECAFLEKRITLRKITGPEWKFALTSDKTGLHFQEFDCTANGVEADVFGTRLRFPLCRVNRIDQHFLFSGAGGELDAAAQGIRLGKMNFALPLPLSEKLPATFETGEIRYDKWDLGKVAATFTGTPEKLTLRGDFRSPLFEGARLDFRGEFRPDAGGAPAFHFEADLPTYVPKTPLQLGDWVPALKGATFTGALTLGAALRLDNEKLTSGLQIFLQDGEFKWPDSKMEATGILFDLRVEDLFTGETPPGQRIKIAKCKAGNLEFSDLDLRFRFESRTMLTIEQARLHWCGGELFLRPLTLFANQKNWAPVLQCESINLAEFLRQTGVAPASTQGDGVIYGKLPLRISRDGLFFEPAYLYSRPGETNYIKIAEPEKLASGMGGAAMQHAQLDFAGEALKNFNYNWVKVRFNTEADDLVLSLQFDGEPAGPLPFAYDDTTGALRRDPTAKATFQGIQLNINTRVPLNLLLGLNRKLQQITEKQP